MDDDESAFLRWASRRHTWLWRLAYSRRWKSHAAGRTTRRAALALLHLDRRLCFVGRG